jgi:hypothetical protein
MLLIRSAIANFPSIEKTEHQILFLEDVGFPWVKPTYGEKRSHFS